MGSNVAPSLWQTTAAETNFPRLEERFLVDVAIVGGGIVGVTTGALLKEAGKTVAVVEMGRMGQGTTGFTTAKLTVGHGLVYRDIASRHGPEAARLYAEANQACDRARRGAGPAPGHRLRLGAGEQLRLRRVF